MDENSLAHTKWKCQYHIVILPKYRRKAIYGKLRKDIGGILRKLCEYKKVEIIEAHAMPDHIHKFLSVTRSINQKLHGEDRETAPKNKSSIRTIQMSKPLIAVLKAHRERQKALPDYIVTILEFAAVYVQ